jgi:type 2 lantibiotic biosynthesis protein LanM
MRQLFIEEVKEKVFFNNNDTNKIYNEEINLIIDEWEEQLLLSNKSLFERKLLKEDITIDNFRLILETIITSKNNINSNIEIKTTETENNLELNFLLIFNDFLNENFTQIAKDLNYYGTYFSINKKNIIQSYRNHILASIAKISEKTIFHEYKSWEEKYGSNLATFISKLSNRHYKYYFYNKYPLLVRLVIDEINRVYNFFKEILSALQNDWEDLKKIVKKNKTLEDLNFGLGDKHVHGKSVSTLIFNDGLKLLYKPHSLLIDDSYSRFIELLFNKNKKLKHVIKNPKVIVRDNYGWQEFIVQKKTDDTAKLKEFYYKTGVHLALFHILNGNDLHYENIIGVSNTPMIIDMETLLSPRISKTENVSLKSVIDVGLLPFGIFRGDLYLQFGGLTNCKNQKSPFKMNVIDIRQSKIEKEDHFMDESKNLPYKTSINLQEYLNDIIDGFSDAYQILLENKKDLFEIINDFFSKSKIRFITRNTLTFSYLLREAYHPYIMTNGFLLEKHLDGLWLEVNSASHLEKVIVSEKKSLLNLDIPYFYTYYNSRSIFDFENKEICNFFDVSPMENIEESIKNISLEDKKRQIWIIKASIISYAN